MDMSTDLKSLEDQARAWKMSPPEPTFRQDLREFIPYARQRARLPLYNIVYFVIAILGATALLYSGSLLYALYTLVLGVIGVGVNYRTVFLLFFTMSDPARKERYLVQRALVKQLAWQLFVLCCGIMCISLGLKLYSEQSLVGFIPLFIGILSIVSTIADLDKLRRHQKKPEQKEITSELPLDVLLTEYLLHQINEQEKEFLAQSAPREVLAQVTQQLSQILVTKVKLEARLSQEVSPSQVLIDAVQLARDQCTKLETQERELREFDASHCALFEMCRQQVTGVKKSCEELALIAELETQVADSDALIERAQGAICQATEDLRGRITTLSEMNQVVRKEAVFEALVKGADKRKPEENIRQIEACVSRLAQTMQTAQ